MLLAKLIEKQMDNNATQHSSISTLTGFNAMLGRGLREFAVVYSPTITNILALPKRISKISMSSQQSDELRWSSLMASAQAGSEADYRSLLVELTQVASAYLRNRLGNSYFIDDCVQESLVAIHQARHTYDPKRPFKPWFFAIVHHKLIDYLRQTKTKQKHMENYQKQHEYHGQANQEAFLQDELDDNHLLNLLSTPHKEVLILTKIYGFTSAETADKLDVSQSAVKVRVHRAINQLRKVLEAENNEK